MRRETSSFWVASRLDQPDTGLLPILCTYESELLSFSWIYSPQGLDQGGVTWQGGLCCEHTCWTARHRWRFINEVFPSHVGSRPGATRYNLSSSAQRLGIQ